MKIREYKKNDENILQTLIEKLMDYVVSTDPIKRIRRMSGYGPNSLKNTLKLLKTNKGKIFFAEDDGEIIGYVFGFVGDRQSGKNLLEVIPTKLGIVEDLYVDEKYRGKRAGSVLMQKIEEYLKSQGCDSLWLEVFATNHNAHEFYKRHGYIDREIGMLKSFGKSEL